MELLNKIVQTLPDERFKILLQKVGVNEQHNNYKLLQLLRTTTTLAEGFEKELNMTPGAFNTFKSRLLKKVSSQLGHLEINPISRLKEETARINQLAFQNPREVAIRILHELEKKLLEYDLSNELAVIYKSLARLHRFYPEYDKYEMLYKKHIAFSLTVTKAEDQLYDFIYHLSHYHLNRQPNDHEHIHAQLLELENVCKLYESHRLYVIYNIARIYYRCSFLTSAQLALDEIEVEETLSVFSNTFARYSQDIFYQNLQHLTPFLFFQYYAKVGNNVKANYYLGKIIELLPQVAHLQLWPFFITQMITAIVSKFVIDGDLTLIYKLEERLAMFYSPSPSEEPHYICYQQFGSMVAFYQGNYSKAAKLINTLRNNVSLKKYPEVEAEFKLFQAFQYALENDPELAERLVASVKRQVSDDETLKPLVKTFGKILALIINHRQNGGEKDRIIKYWQKFKQQNNGRLLNFVRLSLIEL